MKWIDIHTHRVGVDSFAVVDCPFDRMGTAFDFDRCSLSFHPKRLESEAFDELADNFFRQAFDQRVWAIGEVGLDRSVAADRALQFDVFVLLAQMAEQVGKPLIVHCVRLFDELQRAYAMVKPRQAWIVHGFRGKPEQANQLLRLPRLYLSFGYRYNEQTLQQIPIDRLLVETDEHPSIAEVYRQIACERAISIEELLQAVALNVKAVFVIDK